MSESSQETIRNALKNASLSEAEISTWVINLRGYHDEETKRQQTRAAQLSDLSERHNLAVDNFTIAQEALKAEHQALARERAALAQEREALTRERQGFTREREQLHRTIEGLEGDFVTKLLIAFLGAGIALLLLTLTVQLGPLVVSWVTGLF